MFKDNKIKKAMNACGEVIATGTMWTSSATAMTVAGATAVSMTTGINTNNLPRKAAVGILVTAATAATVTTIVAVKKMGFFKKPKVADINRQQVEDYSK